MYCGELEVHTNRKTVAMLLNNIKFLNYPREIAITNIGVTINSLNNITSKVLVYFVDSFERLNTKILKYHQTSNPF